MLSPIGLEITIAVHSKVHSAFHAFVLDKMSTTIIWDKLSMQRDRRGAHPYRWVAVDAVSHGSSCEKGAFGLFSTLVGRLFLSCRALYSTTYRQKDGNFAIRKAIYFIVKNLEDSERLILAESYDNQLNTSLRWSDHRQSTVPFFDKISWRGLS